MNNDTKKAIKKLAEGYTCVMVKGGEERCFTERGVAPLLSLLPHKGGCFADKVVGKGAAALMIAGGVKWVYADVISEVAMVLFEQSRVEVQYKQIVPNIINRAGTDICPVEKLCQECKTAEECLPLIDKFITEMNR
jgi:iron complex outermembrane receptor protein